MGFETQILLRSARILLHYKTVPMGFETINIVQEQKKAYDYKTVPMGFETYVCTKLANNPIIIRQSLWDLKPMISCLALHKLKNYKTVPMGFETLFRPLIGFFCGIIIRQSLWDLKHG